MFSSGEQMCSLRVASCCSFTEVSVFVCVSQKMQERNLLHFIPFIIQTIFFIFSTANPQIDTERLPSSPSKTLILKFIMKFRSPFLIWTWNKISLKKDEFPFLHNIHFKNYIMETYLPLFCIMFYFLLLLHNLPEWFLIKMNADLL